MNNKKIIFIIAALNEEDRIVSTIKSIKAFAQSIVVLDPGSTDETILRAKSEYDIKTVRVTSDMFDVRGRMAAVRNSFLFDISDEWIFPMNSSERFTEELGEILLKIINNNSSLAAVCIYRQSYTFNAMTHNRSLLYIYRSIFKRQSVRMFRMSAWDEIGSRIHNEFPIKKEFSNLVSWIYPKKNRVLIHNRDGHLIDFELKHMSYSTQEAQELNDKGIKPNLYFFIIFVLPSLFYFPFHFFISKKSGIVGVYHIFYKFQVWAKLAELNFNDK